MDSKHEILSSKAAKAAKIQNLTVAEQVAAKGALAGLTVVVGTNGTSGAAVNARDIIKGQGGMCVYGQSARDQKQFKAAMVAADALIPSQHTIPLAGLNAYIENLGGAHDQDLPAVVIHDGQYHLLSGHTRIGTQILAGRTQIIVYLYKFSEEDGWTKP